MEEVTDLVERQDGEREDQRRVQDLAEVDLDVAPGLVDHVAPRRLRELHAQPEERQCALDHDDRGRRDHCVCQQSRQHVRDDFASQDRPPFGPDRLGRGDEFTVRDREAVRPRDSGVGRNRQQPDDETDDEQASYLEDRDERQQQDECREHEYDVEHRHQPGLGLATDETSQRPQQPADDHAAHHRNDCDGDADVRTVDCPGERVTSERIRAERMRP